MTRFGALAAQPLLPLFGAVIALATEYPGCGPGGCSGTRNVVGVEVGIAAEAPISVAAWEERRVTTPRAAGVAGLLFAILFSVSVIIMHATIGEAGGYDMAWLEESSGWFSFAVGLVPFAGIFFLWFIGVVRARLGRFEDQFFSTVFTGSGLLFLAMVFVAAGIAGSIIAGYTRDPAAFTSADAYYFARDMISQIFTIYALRVAAVFLFSLATVWWRTRVMPRWITVVTIPVGLVLLFVFKSSFWVVLLFPAWVFLVSAYILTVSFFRHPSEGGQQTTPPACLPADG